ncbi:SOH1-domain-containing protein [Kockovaella imperatae]|uniref:Mediator of RNA polymerase II transcription subunit 31 n=1 Tax=Kockovaella imperatae TaxID=4999 RepID=A0A1Y1UGB2_9TREE|nr:SOH1-domain-containing protein [Kockovaella imperatae]ORX37062.1 SOH1-domain-containing protein [Kockovaella imperatae]
MQAHEGVILPLPGADGSARSPERYGNIVRFQSELEFVQCLANPLYLKELYTQGLLDNAEMLNYLKYLDYWREPEYVRFIVYPTCLVYLTLIQQETFRSRLGDPAFIEELRRLGTRHHETW